MTRAWTRGSTIGIGIAARRLLLAAICLPAACCLALAIVLERQMARETIEERYVTHAEAVAAGIERRGWLPAFVPETASDIAVLYNLDTNGVRVTFRFPPRERSALVARLRPTGGEPPPPPSTRPGVPAWWPTTMAGFEAFQYVDDRSWWVPIDWWAAIDATAGVAYAWRGSQ
jgi:hypothetical protein